MARLDWHCPVCWKNFGEDDAAKCNRTSETVEYQGVPVAHPLYDPGCPRCGNTDLDVYDEDVHYNKEDWR